jgi:16S rRNA (adenine1518-N6/adenine1519-N6)-dimethyltransferase
LNNLPSLSTILKSYNILPDKKLGQNFLLDQNLTDKIARQAGDLSKNIVLEIGAGPGGLTRSLLKYGAKKVIAVERDNRCILALKELQNHYPDRLEVIAGDALAIEEEKILTGPAKIIANLPYNISTVLLFKWLAKIQLFDCLTLMFQKEVADRIVAEPGNKQFGKISVMAQNLCETISHFDISPLAFFPPPKVTSTVISIIPRSQPICKVSQDELSNLCNILFQQRRKMLRVTLKNLLNEQAIMALGIKPTSRPEELTIEQFGWLAEALILIRVQNSTRNTSGENEGAY